MIGFLSILNLAQALEVRPVPELGIEKFVGGLAPLLRW